MANGFIQVRIYLNLAGLSKAMSQARVPSVGPEKRSLAPFVANFNRSNDLFDIVDAGEMKENADFKIRAMFRQFVENSQCKHIFFAACKGPHEQRLRDFSQLTGTQVMMSDTFPS